MKIDVEDSIGYVALKDLKPGDTFRASSGSVYIIPNYIRCLSLIKSLEDCILVLNLETGLISNLVENNAVEPISLKVVRDDS